MLKQTILLLKEIPFGVSDKIDFAKGSHEIPKKFKDIKRKAKWLSKQ